MTSELRKKNLEDFIETQKYLWGLQYRVIIDEVRDTIAVEFKSIREDQYEQLRVALKTGLMRHVRVETLKMLPGERNQKHKSNGNKKK